MVRTRLLAGQVCARWLGCSVVPQVGPCGACRWPNGPIKHPKVDQDGHGQHDHGRILINDAANCKIRLPVGDFFLKVAIDRGPGPLSITGLKKKNTMQEVGFLNSRRR